MAGNYDIEEERRKRIERLATEFDTDGRQRAADLEWLEDYNERKSWADMGGI